MNDVYRAWHTWSPPTCFQNGGWADFRVTRAHGAYLETSDGRRILDGSAGLWTVNLGHGSEHVVSAISDTLRRLTFLHPGSTQLPSESADRLAKRLLSHAPARMDRVMFHCTGTSAIESSMLVCRRYFKVIGQPQRFRTISLQGSYHGASLFTFSVAGLDELVEPAYGPRVPGCHHVPVPSAGAEQASLDALRALFAEYGAESFAAFVFEPVLTTAGCVVPTLEGMRALVTACRDAGVKVVADEVVTGLGRTGVWFASAALEPDVIVVGKGLSAGYIPLAATLWCREIFEPFGRGEGIALETGSTMDAFPAACAAGLAVLDVLEQAELVERAALMGERLHQRLKRLEALPIVREVRGKGLLYGVVLQDAHGQPLAHAKVDECLRECMREGLLLVSNFHVLCVNPPLIVGEAEIDLLVERLEAVLVRAQRPLKAGGGR
jgi:adenosylmethionine-8-amino-7-oxononanoate aminotransferase